MRKLPKLQKENQKALDAVFTFIEKNPGCLVKDIKLEINKHKACLKNRYINTAGRCISYTSANIFHYKNYENILKHVYATDYIKVIYTKKGVYHFQKDAIIPAEILNKEIN
jgi:hypothetical protein